MLEVPRAVDAQLAAAEDADSDPNAVVADVGPAAAAAAASRSRDATPQPTL